MDTDAQTGPGLSPRPCKPSGGVALPRAAPGPGSGTRERGLGVPEDGDWGAGARGAGELGTPESGNSGAGGQRRLGFRRVGNKGNPGTRGVCVRVRPPGRANLWDGTLRRPRPASPPCGPFYRLPLAPARPPPLLQNCLPLSSDPRFPAPPLLPSSLPLPAPSPLGSPRVPPSVPIPFSPVTLSSLSPRPPSPPTSLSPPPLPLLSLSLSPLPPLITAEVRETDAGGGPG